MRPYSDTSTYEVIECSLISIVVSVSISQSKRGLYLNPFSTAPSEVKEQVRVLEQWRGHRKRRPIDNWEVKLLGIERALTMDN